MYIFYQILFKIHVYKKTFVILILNSNHQATRRHGDVITTSLCTSQLRRRYVSNETPNDVSVERRQTVSVVRLHVTASWQRTWQRLHGTKWQCPISTSPQRLKQASNETPTWKHPKTSQSYATKASQWYVSMTSH